MQINPCPLPGFLSQLNFGLIEKNFTLTDSEMFKTHNDAESFVSGEF
jgi:hypothetical protein